MKECPACQLVNPAEALRCDCGYDFAAHSGGRPRQRAWVSRAIVLLIGIPLGVWHLSTGLRDVYYLPATEGVGSWVILITGYLLTLPAALLALARPRIAALVLIGAGVSSSAATAVAGADMRFLRDMLETVSGPTVALGLTMLWATRDWRGAALSSSDASRRTRG